jgi:8-oxo-dGTP diphosphatase
MKDFASESAGPPLFPHGVEIIVSALIFNKSGQILLIKQLKWGDMWTLPGGHLRVGETLADGAKREGEEETGLALIPMGLLKWGEIIDQESLARPVHFIYFDFCFETRSSHLEPDHSEVHEAMWISPEDALKRKLSPAYRETVKAYNEIVGQPELIATLDERAKIRSVCGYRHDLSEETGSWISGAD